MELAERVKHIAPSSTLAITARASALRAEGLDVIGLGAGEPDFNTPDAIIQAAFEAAKTGHTKYTPAAGLTELKQAIAEKLRQDKSLVYDPKEMIITNGAKHALYLVFQALLNPGDEVVIPAPYWVSYPEQVRLADGVPVIVQGLEENAFKIGPRELEQAITDKTKAVILNSPSNPTGMIYSEDELKEIGDVCQRHQVFIISDEIYDKLVYDGAVAPSIAALSPELQAMTIIINGVSKTYAMTGWRIGYAAGPELLIKAMTNVASHSTSNPTTISQYAALAAYKGEQRSVDMMRAAFEDRLNAAYERLINIPGISCLKPQGAFYLFANARRAADMTGFGSVTEWTGALLDEVQVALVPGDGFGAPDYVRLSYATSQDQMREALNRMHRFMESHIK
ncbi:pyridoxal phosphate-dependent aminotransferase [Camelliibacillus cellulosilyticus]|uniref:Aminotransferase n=1 Tax=Camelliibacillus cellulosilyticus TaxID=2174486 RepID=A0ABV9GHK2_9BACL